MQQLPTIPQPSGQNTPNSIPPQTTIGSARKQPEGWKSVLSTVLVLIAAPVIALLLINFVFQSYEVDGPSMETTLSNKDRLIVWKVPRTIARITDNHYIPARGDIIVFVKKGLFDQNGAGDKQLIKRVIGVPGDRVVVRDGIVTVYNAENPNGLNPDLNPEYASVIKTTNGNVDITVPEGELFVCGDNRVNSLDSRVFGTIPSNDVVGKLVARIFPLNKAETF
ncbi:MAG: signal peptidase [Candidatus Saccharibacteria bacterium]|nr:signal peptidase [Candidatus Saccharibacteria bacterium]